MISVKTITLTCFASVAVAAPYLRGPWLLSDKHIGVTPTRSAHSDGDTEPKPVLVTRFNELSTGDSKREDTANQEAQQHPTRRPSAAINWDATDEERRANIVIHKRDVTDDLIRVHGENPAAEAELVARIAKNTQGGHTKKAQAQIVEGDEKKGSSTTNFNVAQPESRKGKFRFAGGFKCGDMGAPSCSKGKGPYASPGYVARYKNKVGVEKRVVIPGRPFDPNKDDAVSGQLVAGGVPVKGGFGKNVQLPPQLQRADNRNIDPSEADEAD